MNGFVSRLILGSTTLLFLGGAVGLTDLRAAELRVKVTGIANGKGKVWVALHQKTKNVSFPKPKGQVAGQFASAAKGPLIFIFANLTPGKYAIAAFHDTDGNGKLGTNVIGIPNEPYGFSEGARGFAGPPSFAKAAVTVTGKGGSTSVPLR